MTRPILLIFVKEPRAGRVKTRLGRDMGMAASAWWFRHQSTALIRRLSADRRWQTVLAVAPDIAVTSPVWPAHLPRWPQGLGNLGDRMRRGFTAFAPAPVVIIGADIPGITADHVARAFQALGSHDAVFGPAEDGGYWLIGRRRGVAPATSFLHDVRWSSDDTLKDSLATLPDGAKVAMLEPLRDIDTIDDLEELERT